MVPTVKTHTDERNKWELRQSVSSSAVLYSRRQTYLQICIIVTDLSQIHCLYCAWKYLWLDIGCMWWPFLLWLDAVTIFVILFTTPTLTIGNHSKSSCIDFLLGLCKLVVPLRCSWPVFCCSLLCAHKGSQIWMHIGLCYNWTQNGFLGATKWPKKTGPINTSAINHLQVVDGTTFFLIYDLPELWPI